MMFAKYFKYYTIILRGGRFFVAMLYFAFLCYHKLVNKVVVPCCNCFSMVTNGSGSDLKI